MFFIFFEHFTYDLHDSPWACMSFMVAHYHVWSRYLHTNCDYSLQNHIRNACTVTPCVKLDFSQGIFTWVFCKGKFHNPIRCVKPIHTLLYNFKHAVINNNRVVFLNLLKGHMFQRYMRFSSGGGNIGLYRNRMKAYGECIESNYLAPFHRFIICLVC